MDKNNNVLVEEFDNVYQINALDSNKGKKERARIIAACKEENIMTDNVVWSFSNNQKAVEKLLQNGRNRGKGKQVCKFNIQNGELIDKWESLEKAASTLNKSYNTISYDCKHRTVIDENGERYCLLFENEACPEVIREIIEKDRRDNSKYVLYDENGTIRESFASIRAVAIYFNVSDTTIREWLKRGGKVPKHDGYILKKQATTILPICDISNSVSCKKIKEFVDLSNTFEELKRRYEELERQMEDVQRKCSELEGECENLRMQERLRKSPNNDPDIPWMCPIELFLEKKLYLKEGGRCVYILRDDQGKAYVGQSDRDDYSRIREHFISGSQADKVFDAYQSGERRFWIERIITEWGDGTPFNLDDVEAYFIRYYNTCTKGYNQTQGNHQELLKTFDERLDNSGEQ